MKKRMITVAMVLATMVAVTSCKKEKNKPESTPSTPVEMVDATFIRTDTGVNNYQIVKYVNDSVMYDVYQGSYESNNDTIHLPLEKGEYYIYRPINDHTLEPYTWTEDPTDSVWVPIPVDFRVYVGNTLVGSGFGCQFQCGTFFLAEE